MRNRIILLLIGFMCYAGMGNAQEDKTEKAVPAIVSDSVEVAAPGFYRASRLDGGRFGGRTGSEDEAGF